MGPYVVVDVETTGLDPIQDAIIQIALKHSDGREWATFVNPGRPIPSSILQLTGFEAVDFSTQPRISEVGDMVRDFLRSARLVGHNVRFDAGFLARAGIVPAGEPLDTLEWSRLAFPLRSHHGLWDWFGDEETGWHDARVDVGWTEVLLRKICDHLDTFSLELKRDLARFLGWEWEWWGVSLESAGTRVSPLYRPAPDLFEAEPLLTSTIEGGAADWLGESGFLAQSVPGFEVREPQREMARAVEDSFHDGTILLSEAGTGTGKSLAYLTPAALYSLATGERTVIATHTVALQEQLWMKDLPPVCRQWPVKAALVKGRGRYLCLYKTAEVVQNSAVLGEGRERRWALATLLSYIEATDTGDAETFPLKNETGRGLWQEIMADSQSCIGSRCPYAGPCFMRRARHQAESSHLIIVNHALLAAHLANGNVLPEFSHLVIDEAHHFGEVVEKALGFELDREDWDRRYREAMHPSRGVLERVKSGLEFSVGVEVLRTRYKSLDAALKRLGESLAAQTPPGEYDRRSVRVTEPGLELLEESGSIDGWRQALRAFEELGTEAAQLWEQAELAGVAEAPTWLRFHQWRLDMAGFGAGLSLWGELSLERVSWWEVRTHRSGELIVTWRWAPVDIAPILQDKLWSQVKSAVLTSATLAVGGRFQYLSESLGIPAERQREIRLPSPFDWQRQARLIVPRDTPHPGDRDFLDRLARLVVDVANARQGRTLVLLTSYRAVDGIAWRIREELRSSGIRTLAQNIDGPARRLVSDFRQNPRSVLIGTLTYWEGVDIPGDALEVVVLGKLPFRAPGDPLEEAKQDRVRELGHSPFYRRSLPEAVLRFQQGFGRLIRTKSDRGVVIVFDPRIEPGRSRYGKIFLNSLEEVPQAIVAPDEVLPSIEQFWRSQDNAYLTQ